MATAKLTMIGMEQWLNNQDSSLFADWVLPQGINKKKLGDYILLQGGEFEVVYADPDFFREAVGIWGKAWYETFKKWYRASMITYNPLENYDRNESWTEAGAGKTKSKTKDSSTDTEQANAYDSERYKNDGRSISESEAEGSGETETETKHTGRIHGNIGVTTSQQMLESEYKVAAWNVYEHITDMFLKEFTIMVYI